MCFFYIWIYSERETGISKLWNEMQWSTVSFWPSLLSQVKAELQLYFKDFKGSEKLNTPVWSGSELRSEMQL